MKNIFLLTICCLMMTCNDSEKENGTIENHFMLM